MKNRIITNTNRTIKKSLSRFISLLVMSMLGVFVFSGLQATSPDMIETIDNYLDEDNTYDIKIMSNMGLVDDDIEAIKNISGIENVEGSYSKNIIISLNESEPVVNISSIPENINEIELLEGRLPQNKNEIVVEENFISKNNLSLGDTITLNDDVFFEKDVTIVGTVDSSLYYNNASLSQDRGNASIGTGKINYYAYVLPENFNQDYYTYIYITVDGAKTLITSSDEYIKTIENKKDEIEKIKSTQEALRYKTIYDEANKEILKQEQEANEKLETYKKELDEAKNELDTGKLSLNNANSILISTKSQLDTAKNDLNTAKAKLDETKAKLNTANAELNISKEQLNKSLKENNLSETNIDNSIELVESSITQIEKNIVYLPIDSLEYQNYNSQLTELKNKLEKLQTLKNTIEKIKKADSEYQSNLAKYNEGYKTYQSNLAKYNESLAKYNSSKSSYEKNLQIYNENLSKYEESVIEYENKKEDVEEEIANAKKKLEDIKYPSWYIYDRTDGNTYSDYIDDSNSIANLSKIFPVVFFAVAVLVSLISMNRMVEEDRLEIGTLKSLGFSNRTIMTKYLVFSLLATTSGCIIGSILGLTILPQIIFGIYKILFDVPNLALGLNFKSTVLGFLITIICVCGTSIITVYKELKEKPSELMRPKAPKSGKRVFLEKVKILWNNITFSKKVTIRNLFRYKKRVLVTVGGITGCTALMLCGFGIRDAITDIAIMQFDNIFKFDGTVYISEINENYEKIFDVDDIKNATNTQRLNASVNGINSYMFITENNEELSTIVNLEDLESGEKINLEKGKVIITGKLSELTNLKVGDKIEILDVNNILYEYEISGIVKNYIEHYIYIDKETYEQSGEIYTPNIVYINTNDGVNQDDLASQLLAYDEVLNVTFKNSLIQSVDNMLKSLNSVVIILIVLAAMLSFVVLYNLSNININERKREIATLKVLGFYDKEVDDYITKENIILTIFGIALGLIFGYFLTHAVITTVEIEKCRFIYTIKPLSYTYSAVLSIIFTLIVNFITHFKLIKINMIDSLKSVE